MDIVQSQLVRVLIPKVVALACGLAEAQQCLFFVFIKLRSIAAANPQGVLLGRWPGQAVAGTGTWRPGPAGVQAGLKVIFRLGTGALFVCSAVSFLAGQ